MAKIYGSTLELFPKSMPVTTLLSPGAAFALGGPMPETAPYVPGSDTSAAAAESIEPLLGRLAADVRAHVRAQGARGATCDEIEEGLGLRHQTASARVRELAQAGLLKDSGERRATRSGRKAAVWTEG